ncbi:thioesterase family protein [Clostridium merdae]|uniref:thioesterase family protein n=1 Tax=Clostridium merdae TaxID=1958780 RepID=UPI000A2688A3|nr:thioesterase family protein [Clostridium merdae]
MNEPKIGQTLSRDYTVTAADLASAFGSGSVTVLATPKIVALMEGVAAELAQGYLEDGITTVGAEISVKHMAPTAEGVTVKITAELTECDGRKFAFTLQAFDNVGLIATGNHVRASIKTANFLKKAQERAQQ